MTTPFRGIFSLANRALMANAGSLVATTAVTSALGFVYWWVAARMFPPDAVGLASAAVSAMTLLGTASMLGLGTMLMGEFHRRPGQEGALLAAALIVCSVAGGFMGALFAWLAPWVAPELQALSAGFLAVSLFAVGVSLTGLTLVLDQALIGLLRGELQLWRNTIFAAAKLAALILAGSYMTEKLGMTIYATWMIGNFLSVVALASLALHKSGCGRVCQPQWGVLRRLGPSALSHHGLNLALQSASLVLPLLVTAMLSVRMTAYFYIAWMIAGFAFVASGALATALYPVGAREPTALVHRIRLTLGLSVVAGVLSNVVLLVSAGYLLGIFGHTYAEAAGSSLRILGVGAFPLIVKNHFVAICRIQGRIARATLFTSVGGLLELIMAAVGASIGGLDGLSVGWVLAMSVEAVFMVSPVYIAAVAPKAVAPCQVGGAR